MFVGMIPKTYTNEDLLRMLEPHGTIEELNILKSADGKSKGMLVSAQSLLHSSVLVCSVTKDVYMNGAAHVCIHCLSVVPCVLILLCRLCLCSLCIQEPSSECHCQVAPKSNSPSELSICNQQPWLLAP